MKSLKISILAFTAIVMMTSCNQYIQLVETESIGKDAVTKAGVCENEDIRINYDMWAEDGITYFSIYNKAEKPMYIDWKRSVFVYNDWKYDYWVEKSTTQNYIVPTGTGKNITYERKMSTVVSERYTFIPPHTYVSVPMTYVIMNNSLEVKAESTGDNKSTVTATQSLRTNKSLKTSIPSTLKDGASVKAYVKTYTKEDSDNRFRNFLTYAFDEKFASEKYIENDFYVSKKTEMTMKNFNGKATKTKVKIKIGSTRTKGKVKIFDSPYRNGTSFYNTVL